jgi:hypothetical protein
VSASLERIDLTRASLTRSSPGEHLEELEREHHKCDEEKEMDEPACDVKTESEKPENDQNEDDGPQHDQSPPNEASVSPSVKYVPGP